MIHYSRCCYLCARLRLMWWNPHGEMMCSAEGWQSRGEGARRVRGLLNHVHVQDRCPCLSAQTRYKPTVFSLSTWVFFFFLAFPLCGNLCSCSCLSLYSFHVSYHTFDLCLLFAGAWKSTTMSRQGWWFECCTGKENLHQFHSFGLNWSISWDIHLKGFSAGPVFGWKCILDLNER